MGSSTNGGRTSHCQIENGLEPQAFNVERWRQSCRACGLRGYRHVVVTRLIAPWSLATPLGQAREAPADDERSRRSICGFPRLGIFAGGERDHEAAAEIIKAWARVRLEIAMQF